MFKRKTLFVVGAGASVEFGLPSGAKLAETISQKMDVRFELGTDPVGNGDLDLYVQLTQNQRQDANELQRAARIIRDGIVLSRSIDDFLDLHRSNPLVVHYGKAAIVKSILEAERASRLYFGGSSGRERFHPANIADTWLVKFMHMLAPGIPREAVGEIFDNVSFIVFNYDRCVEFFLLDALQKLYDIKADTILEDLDIVHPYGVIDRGIPFGSETAQYPRLAGGIKTYTEQIGDADILTEISEKALNADHIVFLGFAYHDQNMTILKPPKKLSLGKKRIFGTAHGMSDSDVTVVKHQIADWFDWISHGAPPVELVNLENQLKCAGLFDHYAKSLTG